MNTFYFCCSLPLAPGSIVNPGNWGRIIKLYSPQTSPNAWLFVRELIFEQVRREFFPNKPSRFEAIFLCPDIISIQRFKNDNKRILDLVYEVDIIDATAPRHIGDWSLCNMDNSYNHSIFIDRARQYWAGNSVTNPEVCTTSSIKVLREMI